MARLLLVDGEADFRVTARQALEEGGHFVEEAATGVDALARVRHEAYDLVVTELYLSEMTGLEFVAALQSLGRAAPCTIMLSDLGDWGTHAQALELGVTAFLNKPVEMAELSHQVARALSRCQAPRPCAAGRPPSLPVAAIARRGKDKGVHNKPRGLDAPPSGDRLSQG